VWSQALEGLVEQLSPTGLPRRSPVCRQKRTLPIGIDLFWVTQRSPFETAQIPNKAVICAALSQQRIVLQSPTTKRYIKMMMMNQLLAIAAFLGAAAAYEVPSLTPDNFDAITAGKTVFIKFFAPWVSHYYHLVVATNDTNKTISA
jgi:hypothetical protein